MLLEREGELKVLRDLFRGLPEGGGKVVLIRGEAGIGKSALVAAFVASCANDAYVHQGSCDDLFVPQPLGPFWDMAPTEPSLQEPLDAANRPLLFTTLLGLMSRPARPTVMVIEDTHWAEQATLDAIRYLGRRVARTNGLLVLTYREGDVDLNHPLRSVIGDMAASSVVRIRLGGLSLAGVTSMVGRSGLDPTKVLAATGGNPLLITEMAAAGGSDVPASLHDSVMTLVAKLSPMAQETLKTLAVLPEPVSRADAVGLDGVDEEGLEECQRRGLLNDEATTVTFRHDLIRRIVESMLSEGERRARMRAALERLPADTHACLVVYLAWQVGDVDRLIEVAPISARYNVAVGGHVLAALDYMILGQHLDHVSPDFARRWLDEWAAEEYIVGNISEAIRINEMALQRHREAGDGPAESRALAAAAQYHEGAGHREKAEQLAAQAIEVLGPRPEASDLAAALEANAYLQMMAGNVDIVPDLVERTLDAGGPGIDEHIRIRSLNHRGMVANMTSYPAGRSSLDEARERATAAEDWYEESRALLNQAWAAVEWQDLPTASDYAQRAIASASRHEVLVLETNARAQYARVLELSGRWTEASDAARDLIEASGITQMVVGPLLGAIEARRGRDTAREALLRSWEAASEANEFQRLAPAAYAAAEFAWITGHVLVTAADLRRVMSDALAVGLAWSPGKIAYWLWALGELAAPPPGIAEPYRLVMTGHARAAATIWHARGVPYERALALGHGDSGDRAEALEMLESLGASAVAARLRRSWRSQGLNVPRGRGSQTRRHVAGLTARQAEVLELLDQRMTNAEIADRLFLSPRTVESHVAAVLDKLDVATREDAVSQARSDGLLAATA